MVELLVGIGLMAVAIVGIIHTYQINKLRNDVNDIEAELE